MHALLRIVAATVCGVVAAPIGGYIGGCLASYIPFRRPTANGGGEMVVIGFLAACSAVISGAATFGLIVYVS